MVYSFSHHPICSCCCSIKRNKTRRVFASSAVSPAMSLNVVLMGLMITSSMITACGTTSTSPYIWILLTSVITTPFRSLSTIWYALAKSSTSHLHPRPLNLPVIIDVKSDYASNDGYDHFDIMCHAQSQSQSGHGPIASHP